MGTLSGAAWPENRDWAYVRDWGDSMRTVRAWQQSFLCAILIARFPLTANAGGKIQIYGLRMTPTGQDASRFSRASWGGGLSVIAPLPSRPTSRFI